ncbi:sce7725 family protein [uncultured Secundilactobacillus sp.]|uniref:sce7725 family protein n=1 Tax=uncultured Secundilactobacillus sp. TaxID=2813935 RepID=UPI0025831BCE|nr:sce7725 family protein [uncultured Secundilactobacillus sp.]
MRYFPYFRGRQYDLRALQAFAQTPFNNITPIIEPVRDIPALPQTLTDFIQADQPIALVLNPRVGHYHFDAPAKHPIQSVLATGAVTPAFILSPLLPPEQLVAHPTAIVIVQHFDDLALFLARDWLPETLTLLVPPEARIRRQLRGRPFGHLVDHFVPGEYAPDTGQLMDSFFSDDRSFAATFGEIGFSDFLTVGQPYSEHGFPTKAVTLHLTYLKDGRVRIRHFQSDDHADFRHQREKFFQALIKAVMWINQAPTINQTPATDQLLTLANEHHFPGMGIIKALTLTHHLTMMNRYLNY